MGNTTFNLSSSHASDAAFQTWAQGVHDGLLAAGMTQTADTGQVDISTMTRSVGPPNGYRCYMMTSGTCVRVRFGTHGSINQPKLTFQAGTGFDGSGTLLNGSTEVQASPGNSTATTGSWRISCDGYGLVVQGWLGDTAHHFMWVVDESRNADGTANNAGLAMQNWYQATNKFVSEVWNGTVWKAISNGGLQYMPFALTAGSSYLDDDNQVSAFPGYISTPDIWPLKMLMAYPYADLSLDTDQQFSFLGATRTYRALGNNYPGADVWGQSALTPLIWWSD